MITIGTKDLNWMPTDLTFGYDNTAHGRVHRSKERHPETGQPLVVFERIGRKWNVWSTGELVAICESLKSAKHEAQVCWSRMIDRLQVKAGQERAEAEALEETTEEPQDDPEPPTPASAPIEQTRQVVQLEGCVAWSFYVVAGHDPGPNLEGFICVGPLDSTAPPFAALMAALEEEHGHNPADEAEGWAHADGRWAARRRYLSTWNSEERDAWAIELRMEGEPMRVDHPTPSSSPAPTEDLSSVGGANDAAPRADTWRLSEAELEGLVLSDEQPPPPPLVAPLNPAPSTWRVDLGTWDGVRIPCIVDHWGGCMWTISEAETLEDVAEVKGGWSGELEILRPWLSPAQVRACVKGLQMGLPRPRMGYHRGRVQGIPCEAHLDGQAAYVWRCDHQGTRMRLAATWRILGGVAHPHRQYDPALNPEALQMLVDEAVGCLEPGHGEGVRLFGAGGYSDHPL